MKSIRTAQNELNNIKNDVIGIFKMKNSNVFELVVNYQKTDETVDVIRITQFGVIQLEYDLPIHFGKLKLFPDRSNMNDMLDNSFEWEAFIKSFS